MPAAVPGMWPSRWTLLELASGGSAGARAAEAVPALSASVSAATARTTSLLVPLLSTRWLSTHHKRNPISRPIALVRSRRDRHRHHLVQLLRLPARRGSHGGLRL